MFLLVWTETVNDYGDCEDHWIAYETYEDAAESYEKLLTTGVYSASVCTVVVSTDYEGIEDE